MAVGIVLRKRGKEGGWVWWREVWLDAGYEIWDAAGCGVESSARGGWGVRRCRVMMQRHPITVTTLELRLKEKTIH
jgi:hypothetical protein